jgi:A/G-specific adenine glycosylase
MDKNSDHNLDKFPFSRFRDKITQWWNLSGHRRFPWRDTKDPYKILVAETLLHRTRAEQVVPLYQRFIDNFPDIHSVTKSSPDELTRLLYSAGLRWRWKQFYTLSVDIEDNFNGKIPSDFNELTSLPGISHYIASAIRCFAFGYSDVLLDTNTVRVTGRVFGLPITDSSRRSRQYRELLERLISATKPREFNFSLIDLAATICKPKNQLHNLCPIQEYCTYYKQQSDSGDLHSRLSIVSTTLKSKNIAEAQ